MQAFFDIRNWCQDFKISVFYSKYLFGCCFLNCDSHMLVSFLGLGRLIQKKKLHCDSMHLEIITSNWTS